MNCATCRRGRTGRWPSPSRPTTAPGVAATHFHGVSTNFCDFCRMRLISVAVLVALHGRDLGGGEKRTCPGARRRMFTTAMNEIKPIRKVSPKLVETTGSPMEPPPRSTGRSSSRYLWGCGRAKPHLSCGVMIVADAIVAIVRARPACDTCEGGSCSFASDRGPHDRGRGCDARGVRRRGAHTHHFSSTQTELPRSRMCAA